MRGAPQGSSSSRPSSSIAHQVDGSTQNRSWSMASITTSESCSVVSTPSPAATPTPELPKRYAPLLFATVVEARRAAGQAVPTEGVETALTRLGTIANDPDGYTRLHVTRALGVIGSPAAADLLIVRMADDQMRVRWAAAAALERIGDPRGFTEVVRLLNDVAPSSKHIIRDVLVSYAARLQNRPLSDAEILELGLSPAQWSRWFTRFQSARAAAG